MPITVLENIKGKELPKSWQKGSKFDPDQIFTVTLKAKDEDENMPAEEMISEELIASVKRSDEDIEAGRFTRCRSKEERKAHYEKLSCE